METHFIELVKKEVTKKGFMVYDYISLDELLMTVRKDYLDILSYINIPFWIISIILWVLSYQSGFVLLFWFLFISYAIIFCVLFFKLIQKTYYFMLLKNVLFTKQWLILGKNLYKFSDQDVLLDKLMQYENIFLEYLGSKSRLNEYIDSKKKDIIGFKKNNKAFLKASEIFKETSRGWSWWWDIWKILIPIIISVGVYIIFMYVFYYLGYIFWYIMTKIYSVFIKILLYVRWNTEYKIKTRTETIDANLKKMNQVYEVLDTKYNDFIGGDISNIAKFTKNNFDSFYTEIFAVYKDKEKLEELITKSSFKDFIEFRVFEKYLKIEFNKPVKSMIALLKKYQKLVQKNLAELDNTQAKDKVLSGTLETKKRILENNLLLLENNILKLKNSII